MDKQTRRSFIASAVVLTAGAVSASALPTFTMETKSKKQLAHHVFFWLKNADSVEDRNKLIEGLKTLSKIETVKKLHIGIPASVEKRDVVDASYQVSELMFFDDIEGQNAYQVHPIHKDFIKNYGHLWSKVVVYDAMEV
jgi:hypothetical protein